MLFLPSVSSSFRVRTGSEHTTGSSYKIQQLANKSWNYLALLSCQNILNDLKLVYLHSVWILVCVLHI